MLESPGREHQRPSHTVQRLEKQIAKKDTLIAQRTKNLLLLTGSDVIASVKALLQSVQKERLKLAQALDEERMLLTQGEGDELACQATDDLLRKDWADFVSEGHINVADADNA